MLHMSCDKMVASFNAATVRFRTRGGEAEWRAGPNMQQTPDNISWWGTQQDMLLLSTPPV
jgi:hypothetical protein